MTLDPAFASVVVALIAALASIVTAILTQKQNRKIGESHRMLTVNHHESERRGEEPTVLDRIDDVRTAVLGLGADVNDLRRDFNTHVAHSNQMDLRLYEIEDHIDTKGA